MERAERRMQVLVCARRIFAHRGYHRTNISDIIAAAGIARGTFYVYFRNKRAIFAELLDDLLARLQAAIRKIELGESAEPVMDQMRGNVERVVDLLCDNADMARILLRASVGLDAEFDRKLGAFYERLIAMAARSIQNGLSMKLVRPCDPATTAQMIVGAIKEVALHGIAGAAVSTDAASRARLSAEVLEFVSRALFVPEAQALVRTRLTAVGG